MCRCVKFENLGVVLEVLGFLKVLDFFLEIYFSRVFLVRVWCFLDVLIRVVCLFELFFFFWLC